MAQGSSDFLRGLSTETWFLVSSPLWPLKVGAGQKQAQEAPKEMSPPLGKSVTPWDSNSMKGAPEVTSCFVEERKGPSFVNVFGKSKEVESPGKALAL